MPLQTIIYPNKGRKGNRMKKIRTNVSMPKPMYDKIKSLQIGGETISETVTRLLGQVEKENERDITATITISWEQAKNLPLKEFERFLDNEMASLYNDVYDYWSNMREETGRVGRYANKPTTNKEDKE